MAGSFDIFRKYQRSLLAAVAILAMLAFFVLPPFLQMAPDVGAADPLVATWRGGGIREGELQRAVAMRSVLNQFLRDAIAASGRDPGDMQVLGEDEADVVQTLLLAQEAKANGIVIGNGAVNRFLAQWTNNMVRPEQFESLLSGRRLGYTAVSAADVFEALRTVLAADRMRQFSFAGFAGDPPGARWETFRRLEQQATVEVVPVVVESLAGEVPPPDDTVLRGFFEQHRDALPVDRSPEPGFKEPHRISYDWIEAPREDLEAAAEKDVTDEQIAAFYEENKVRLYRVKSSATPPAEGGEAAQAPADAEKASADKESARGTSADAATTPTPDPKPATDAAPAGEKPAADAGGGKPAGAPEPAAGSPQSQAPRRGPFMPVSFRLPAATSDAAPAASSGAEPAAGDAKAADASAGESAKPAAAGAPAAAAPADVAAVEGVEPLEKVKDDVRRRLAGQAVDRRIDGLFRAITSDVVGFSRDLSRWKAESGDAAVKPVPPSAEAIAAKQGLRAGRGEKRSVGDALREGGVGRSFQLSLDPRSPMGFRQGQWADIFFGIERPLWRPIDTRDVPGNRYLTWKTEDFPEFVPEFADVRADVERAWRIVEARPSARKVAEEIVAGATAGRTLAEVAAARGGTKLEATTVGPFTWLPPDTASSRAPSGVSQPEGLEMPGEEFMQAVFALEPGGTAVAFNEPRTVCYAIRLVSFSPPDDDLRTRFIAAAADRRPLAAATEREQAKAFEAWLAGVERRAGLEWKRPPERR